MELLFNMWYTLLATFRDVVLVIVLLLGFQILVLKRPIREPRKTAIGFLYVIVGLALFLVGLERALFPIGEIMAKQLSDPLFVFGSAEAPLNPAWWRYGWVYLFAFMIGFSTTIAEPALIAVALKASEVSGGGISQWGLRLAVAMGVALGITLGVFRIITGTPLFMYMAVGYLIVVIQTAFAPKKMVPLAYDTGGVTTSTVTVPLVAALGLGLSATIPGRNPVLDGFGLIAFASLFPMITVMGYVQIYQWWSQRPSRSLKEKQHAVQVNHSHGQN